MPTPKMMYRKLKDALRGLRVTISEELSFKLEVAGIIPLVILMYFFWPLEEYQIMALIITYGLVLITELVNTSLETALERLHPERHGLIGRAKDVAAGAVVIAILLLVAVIVLIIF